MTTITVIGGGIAGMGAARALLLAGMQVTLVESARGLGGNCLGVRVRDGSGSVHEVDAGVSDFNRTTFVAVARLIDELGLETHPIGTDTDFVAPHGTSLAHCRDGAWSFDPREVDDPQALAAEIAAFRERAAEVLRDARFASWSLGRWLDHAGASPAFRRLYVYPRAIGCFPMPDRAPEDQPVLGLVTFWSVHGLVGHAPSRRHCVVGGMHRYVAALRRWLLERGARVMCATRALGVVRRPRGVEVRTVDHRDRHARLVTDHVLMSGHAHDALALLDDSTPEEREILGRFAYQRARLVVHQDETLMGHDRDAWGAFNYVVPEGDLPRVRPTITFHPNRLCRLPASVPSVFVTMNPHREPRPERVLLDRFFLHPIADGASRAAIPTVELLQGRRRTWFAGADPRVPHVHESALQSGIDAAQRLILVEQGAAASA